jgi:hypothetical protein
MGLLDPEDDLLAGLGLYPAGPDYSGVGMQFMSPSLSDSQQQALVALSSSNGVNGASTPWLLGQGGTSWLPTSGLLALEPDAAGQTANSGGLTTKLYDTENAAKAAGVWHSLPDDFTPGQSFTYNAEAKSTDDSNHMSWPASLDENNLYKNPQAGEKVGVTIGHGYDMGGKTEAQVYADLRRAGVDEDRASILAGGAGKQGLDAQDYANKHHQDAYLNQSEADNLFSNSYADKERNAKDLYGETTKNVPGAVKWQNLNPKIRDIAVDLMYQGLAGAKTMQAVATNNADSLMQLIQRNNANKFEPIRGRLRYLQQTP